MPDDSELELANLVDSVSVNAKNAAATASALRDVIKQIDGAVETALRQYYPGKIIDDGVLSKSQNGTWHLGVVKSGNRYGLSLEFQRPDGTWDSTTSWLVHASVDWLGRSVDRLPALLKKLNEELAKRVAENQVQLQKASKVAAVLAKSQTQGGS